MEAKTKTPEEVAKELGIDTEGAGDLQLTEETLGEMSNGKGDDEDE